LHHNIVKTYIGAVENILWKDLPVGANVIIAHSFFTVKPDDPSPGMFRLKNRAVIHRKTTNGRIESPWVL
jgi:hypothetical protein